MVVSAKQFLIRLYCSSPITESLPFLSLSTPQAAWVVSEDFGPNGAKGKAVFNPAISVSLVVTLYRVSCMDSGSVQGWGWGGGSNCLWCIVLVS